MLNAPLEDWLKLFDALKGKFKDADGKYIYEPKDSALIIKSHLRYFSLYCFFTSITCFILSEIFNSSFFNSLGVLILGLAFIWISILAYGAKEIISKSNLLLNTFRWVGFFLLLVLGVAVFMWRLPAGLDAWPILLIYFVLIVGLGALGVRFTKEVIGTQLVIGAVIAGATLLLPKTVASIGTTGASVDRQIRQLLLPEPVELDMTLAVMRGNSADAPPLFIDGDPEWWCRTDDERDSGYRCFDQSGPDRTTSEILFPITPTVIEDAIRNLKEAQIRRKKLEEKQAEDQRIQAEKKAAIDANIARDKQKEIDDILRLDREKIRKENEKRQYDSLVYSFAVNSYSQDDVIIGANSEENNNLSRYAVDQIYNILSKRLKNSGLNVDKFRPDVYHQGYFDQIMEGRTNILDKVGLKRKMRAAILVNVRTSCRPSIQDLKSCSVSVDIRLLAKTAAGSSLNHVSEVGVGVTSEQAVFRAIELVVERHAHLFDGI